MKNFKILIALSCFIIGCSSTKSNNRFSDEEIANTKITESTTIHIESNNLKVVDIDDAFDNRHIDIDNLFDTVYFVTLETKAESVLGDISKMIITDNRIFIGDIDYNLLIFDIEGKFVTKLTKGQGPDEIIGAWNFTFDDERKQLIVYDQSDCLKYYDINGKCISIQKLPLLFHDFCTCGDYFVFFQPDFLNMHLGNDARYAILMANKEMEIKQKGISLSENDYIRSKPYIMKDDNRVFVSQVANDTIFEVLSSNIAARYLLRYDNHKANVCDIGSVKTSDKYYHSSGYLENDRTQIFNFESYKRGPYVIIRDKVTGKKLGGKSFTCSVGYVPLCSRAKCVHNNFFVAAMQPEQGMHFSSNAISEADNKKLEGLTEEDNPVLVFYKYKEIK